MARFRSWTSALASAAVLAAGIAAFAGEDGQDREGNGRSQASSGDAFHQHNDDGDDVHVLPSPDTLRFVRDVKAMFAAPKSGASVYAASYGSGNLSYHGGKVMKTPRYYAVYWNSAVANSTATSLGYATLQSQIASFVNTFFSGVSYSNSTVDDYSIVGQYGDSSGNKPVPTGGGLAGQVVSTKATANSISDNSIKSYLTTLFAAGAVPVDTNAIYGIYFPSGMKVTMGGSSSCTSFCGYHSHLSYNGVQVKYAVFPYPDCSGCKISSLTVADMLTIVGSHEIREAVTDPGDSNRNAWYDSVGYEADDKCAWHNLYQMKRSSGLNFWIQPEYSNGGGIYPGAGCVVP